MLKVGLRDFLKQKLGARPTSSAPASASLPAAPDADGYRAVAVAGSVSEGRPRVYGVNGAVIAVFQVQGALYAIDNACAHEDGPLGEGDQRGEVITCPYHDWRFDVRTGACLSEPGRRQACFAVREQGGFLWIGRRTSEGTGVRGGEHDDGLKQR